jgi:hypothetical protein
MPRRAVSRRRTTSAVKPSQIRTRQKLCRLHFVGHKGASAWSSRPNRRPNRLHHTANQSLAGIGQADGMVGLNDHPSPRDCELDCVSSRRVQLLQHAPFLRLAIRRVVQARSRCRAGVSVSLATTVQPSYAPAGYILAQCLVQSWILLLKRETPVTVPRLWSSVPPAERPWQRWNISGKNASKS